jgi:hypothetical protein
VEALQPELGHQPGDPLAAVPAPLPAQQRVHPRGAVAALGLAVHGDDLLRQLGVGSGTGGRGGGALGV